MPYEMKEQTAKRNGERKSAHVYAAGLTASAGSSPRAALHPPFLFPFFFFPFSFSFQFVVFLFLFPFTVPKRALLLSYSLFTI